MWGHPKGLSVLFFTEMWERFSYYGMKTILVLFLVSTSKGGYGWDSNAALTLLGIYSMMVYVMSIPGGMLADRFLGQRKAVLIGGALLCAGHLLMAFPPKWAFYTALVLLVFGVGLLKPNISTMVGGLYKDGDPRRDGGFTIFYMGINLGSFLATLIVSWVGEKVGWHVGFSLAGFGMLLGQFVFITGSKHLGDVGLAPPKRGKTNPLPKKPFTRQEKDRIGVICLSLVLVGVFWIAFEQGSGLLTLYAKEYTDRTLAGVEIPAGMFLGLNSGFILLLGGLVARYWQKRSQSGKPASAIFKMGIGTIILGLGFAFMVGALLQRGAAPDGKSAMYWLVGIYLFHTVGELCLSPVALSFITKVAPKRIMATMMGIFWAVTGLANFFAAEVGKLALKLGEMSVFVGFFVFCVLLGTTLALLARRINHLTHGTEEVDTQFESQQKQVQLKAATT